MFGEPYIPAAGTTHVSPPHGSYARIDMFILATDLGEVNKIRYY